MAEKRRPEVSEPAPSGGATPEDRHGLLEHSREFLDFFWDIAKPQQQTRLEATEKLLAYLRTRPEARWWGLGQGRTVAAVQAKESGGGPFCYRLTRDILLISQGSEMKYALKRLITGLGVGREAARPCYSMALAQVRRCCSRGPAVLGRVGGREEGGCPGCKGVAARRILS